MHLQFVKRAVISISRHTLSGSGFKYVKNTIKLVSLNKSSTLIHTVVLSNKLYIQLFLINTTRPSLALPFSLLLTALLWIILNLAITIDSDNKSKVCQVSQRQIRSPSIISDSVSVSNLNKLLQPFMF